MKPLTYLIVATISIASSAHATTQCYSLESNRYNLNSICYSYDRSPENSVVSISVIQNGIDTADLMGQGGPSHASRHCSKDHDCWVDPRGVQIFADDAKFEVSLYLLDPYFSPGRASFNGSYIKVRSDNAYINVR